MITDTERLDFLQRQLHDESTGAIGDLALYGSWGGMTLQVGSEDLFAPINTKGSLRDLLDAAIEKGITVRASS